MRRTWRSGFTLIDCWWSSPSSPSSSALLLPPCKKCAKRGTREMRQQPQTGWRGLAHFASGQWNLASAPRFRPASVSPQAGRSADAHGTVPSHSWVPFVLGRTWTADLYELYPSRSELAIREPAERSRQTHSRPAMPDGFPQANRNACRGVRGAATVQPWGAAIDYAAIKGTVMGAGQLATSGLIDPVTNGEGAMPDSVMGVSPISRRRVQYGRDRRVCGPASRMARRQAGALAHPGSLDAALSHRGRGRRRHARRCLRPNSRTPSSWMLDPRRYL